MSRLAVGQRLPPMVLHTLAHGEVEVPDPGGTLVHLSFRRFAGCPICNLHLRATADRLAEIHAAGIKPVAFLHSTAEAMRPFQGDLPFAVVPDPTKRWFAELGVETDPLSILHPAAMLDAARGMLSVRSHPLKGEGGHGGLPADFLVAPGGRIVDLRYGRHPADAWSVDEVLEAAARGQGALS